VFVFAFHHLIAVVESTMVSQQTIAIIQR